MSANGSSSNYYNAVAQQHQSHQNYYNNVSNNRISNYRNRYGGNQQQQQQNQLQQQQAITRQAINRQGGYQLKVGGVVVGSWAGSAPNRNGVQARLNRAVTGNAQFVRYPINSRVRTSANSRLQRNVTLAHNQHVSSLARTISRNTYGVKVNRNRNRRSRNKDRKGAAKQTNKDGTVKKDNAEKGNEETEENETSDTDGKSSPELPNG